MAIILLHLRSVLGIQGRKVVQDGFPVQVWIKKRAKPARLGAFGGIFR